MFINKELKKLILFTFISLLLLPIPIFIIGNIIFGEYGGNSYFEFFMSLITALLKGSFGGWFLILAPYLAWQLINFLRNLIKN